MKISPVEEAGVGKALYPSEVGAKSSDALKSVRCEKASRGRQDEAELVLACRIPEILFGSQAGLEDLRVGINLIVGQSAFCE